MAPLTEGTGLWAGIGKSVSRQFDDTPGGGFADQIADAPGLQDNLNDGQDDFKLTGAPKEVMDTMFDYERIQNPETGETAYTDQEDVIGPSWDASDLGNGKLGLDWRSEKSQENDPTAPSNNWFVKWLMNNPGQFVAVLVGIYLLSLLSPLLEMGANLTEGA